jgi:hypothetical protein
MDMGNGKPLVPAKGVRYLARQWCVMSPEASISDPNLPNSIAYACSYADCTSLGYGSSCGMLDAKSNASYAFNMYYQTVDQRNGACSFSNLSTLTKVDPSQNPCRFEIMMDLGKHETPPRRSFAGGKENPAAMMAFISALILIICGAY